MGSGDTVRARHCLLVLIISALTVFFRNFVFANRALLQVY